MDSVTVSEAKQAVQDVETRRAAVHGSGSADEADLPESGMTLSHCSAKLHASQAETCYSSLPKPTRPIDLLVYPRGCVNCMM